jgi:hypothetical protein
VCSSDLFLARLTDDDRVLTNTVFEDEDLERVFRVKNQEELERKLSTRYDIEDRGGGYWAPTNLGGLKRFFKDYLSANPSPETTYTID